MSEINSSGWNESRFPTPIHLILMRALFLLAVLCFTSVAFAAEAPVPVRTVSPDYPPAMRSSGASGVVVINCLIDERGNVSDTKIEKSSNVAFERPAVEALQKWKFKPATENGTAVSTRVVIPIKFICET
jgi:periplasmic protein TonB